MEHLPGNLSTQSRFADSMGNRAEMCSHNQAPWELVIAFEFELTASRGKQ